MNQNIVINHLSAEQWAAVDTALAALKAALEPGLLSLSPDQRKRMVKMGEGSESFCRTAAEVFGRNLGLMPRDFDVEEMRRDLQSHDALKTRMLDLTQLLEKARDTDLALGSDAMAAALEGYAVIKATGRAEGVDALRKLLGQRFQGSSRVEAPAEAG